MEDRDSEKLLEIVKAIEFLRTFKPKGNDKITMLLFYKRMLELCGQQWPIKQLAKFTGWDVDESDYGYPRLRTHLQACKFSPENHQVK